jgi:predicted DNA-binding transcriptional regulator AlpA
MPRTGSPRVRVRPGFSGHIHELIKDLRDPLRAADLAKALRVTARTICNWGKDGTLPPPLPLGSRAARWTHSQLLQHFAASGQRGATDAH